MRRTKDNKERVRRLRHALFSGLFAVVCSAPAVAQGQSFIGSFTLTEVNSGGISVDWTIQSGNTCDGIDVERSTDSLNFVTVHHIEGICGSIDSPVSYHWFDPSPPELATAYYRLRLGFFGHSMVRSIFYGQLSGSSQRIYPNPASDKTTLVLNVRSASPIEVRLFAMNGQLVLVRSAASGPHVEVDLTGLPVGMYTYRAVAEGRTFTGKLVKD
jgi:hypothetical protein